MPGGALRAEMTEPIVRTTCPTAKGAMYWVWTKWGHAHHEVDVGVDQVLRLVDQRAAERQLGGIVVEHLECVVGDPGDPLPQIRHAQRGLIDRLLAVAEDVDPQRQFQDLHPGDALQRHGETIGLILQHDELLPDRDERAGGGAVLAFVFVAERDLEILAGFEPRPLGGRVGGGVVAVELDALARPGADDVHRLRFTPGVDRQRAERGRRHLPGNAPAVAELDLAFPHEEAQAVLEDRDALGLRAPDVGILGGRGGLGFPLGRRRFGFCPRGQASRETDHRQYPQQAAATAQTTGTHYSGTHHDFSTGIQKGPVHRVCDPG